MSTCAPPTRKIRAAPAHRIIFPENSSITLSLSKGCWPGTRKPPPLKALVLFLLPGGVALEEPEEEPEGRAKNDHVGDDEDGHGDEHRLGGGRILDGYVRDEEVGVLGDSPRAKDRHHLNDRGEPGEPVASREKQADRDGQGQR